MLERLTIRNFKRFRDAEIELGEAVVFIGPNNAGKTSALQALALWELGVRRWTERRSGKATPTKRYGVTINRRDIVALPVPETNHLWRNLHVQEGGKKNGKPSTQKVYIELAVDGVSSGKRWSSALDFYYANAESIYCRPHGWSPNGSADGPTMPDEARSIRIAYLPPMSGLSASETRLDHGAVQVRLGEGRTAEVLRNLCYQLCPKGVASPEWQRLEWQVKKLFGVDLELPVYIPERGEIAMSYRDSSGIQLDISAAGRGLQQTLLLLAYLYGNRNVVVMLDEPDAHLEILRQRQTYNTLTDVARERGCQVVAASHSEVLLNEAADRDVVVAFVGKPHRIDDRTQVFKALRSIGFEHYYQAEQNGWVLYLEGATDLSILQSFATLLKHPAEDLLERPFVHYIENQPSKAREHFYGLREAKGDLVGIILLDRMESDRPEGAGLRETMWSRREIENYLCQPETLEAYAASLVEESSPGPLFAAPEREKVVSAMREAIRKWVPPAAFEDRGNRWWRDVKASDEFLDLVFEAFFGQLAVPNLMRKSDYHRLARFVPPGQLDPEIASKLDLVVEVAGRAKPLVEEA